MVFHRSAPELLGPMLLEFYVGVLEIPRCRDPEALGRLSGGRD